MNAHCGCHGGEHGFFRGLFATLTLGLGRSSAAPGNARLASIVQAPLVPGRGGPASLARNDLRKQKPTRHMACVPRSPAELEYT